MIGVFLNFDKTKKKFVIATVGLNDKGYYGTIYFLYYF